MAAFAKEHISKPVCSVRHVEYCSSDEKAVIDGLRAKSREELEAVEVQVAERVQAAQDVYDAALEEIQTRYEETTSAFNSEIDVIRSETNFKWVQQILAMSDTSDSEGTKDEL
jgi:cupin superfamily acireductone dioxygenase involved in methionine salvage